MLIPATIDEAIAELEMHSEFIQQIKAMTQSQFLASQHFGLALWIRNNWELWQSN